MKYKLIKISATALSFALAAMVFMAPAQDAAALLPLSYNWECDAYAHCSFTVTTTNHASYGWNFGDGNFDTSKGGTINHSYSVSPGWHTFHVALVGYKSRGGIDNIVGCDITFHKSGPGGDPSTYSGSC